MWQSPHSEELFERTLFFYGGCGNNGNFDNTPEDEVKATVRSFYKLYEVPVDSVINTSNSL